jgi:hypothetical protein
MFIEITGYGTQGWPFGSYHEVEPVLNDADELIAYELNWGSANYVPAGYATEISAIPCVYAVLPREYSDIKINPEFVFHGLSANEYEAQYVYHNGNTTGMPHLFAMEYNRWYSTFKSLNLYGN